MAKTFDVAPDELYQMLDRVLGQYHPEIQTAEVSFGIVMVSKIDKEGTPEPALKVRGHEVVTKIKVTSCEARARGAKDVEITIDQHSWNRLATNNQKLAIFDHDLNHLELVPNNDVDDGSKQGPVLLWKTDSNGRPKLKLGNHDMEFGGFSATADRFKNDSQEVIQANEIVSTYGSSILPDGLPEATSKE